jgi:hypothetical protein
VQQYGNTDSGASLGDILGDALKKTEAASSSEIAQEKQNTSTELESSR